MRSSWDEILDISLQHRVSLYWPQSYSYQLINEDRSNDQNSLGSPLYPCIVSYSDIIMIPKSYDQMLVGCQARSYRWCVTQCALRHHTRVTHITPILPLGSLRFALLLIKARSTGDWKSLIVRDLVIAASL